jgi:hypothetical protein
MVRFIMPLRGALATNNASRFCFAPDVSRPLLELEQMFFDGQRGGNGEIT